MKKVLMVVVVTVGCLQASQDKISCNERVKHGPRGFYKGLVALGSAVACGYFVWDIFDKVPDLRVPDEINHKAQLRRWPLIKGLFLKTISASSLGYVAWKFGKESKESLTIFYQEDPEA